MDKILQFPPKDKIQLLRELERDMFQERVENLFKELKDVPLTYDEIQREVEDVRGQKKIMPDL